jgi:hypothetical protein
MDQDPLGEWCQVNGLSRIEANLRDQGISSPQEFEHLTTDDLDEIIKSCGMNLGEKARFRRLFQPPAPTPTLSTNPDEKILIINNTKYQTQAKLGKGGFGTVWKAIDLANPNVVVAIKESHNPPNDMKDCFEIEAEQHEKISQEPYVPRVPKLIASSTVSILLSRNFFSIISDVTRTQHQNIL